MKAYCIRGGTMCQLPRDPEGSGWELDFPGLAPGTLRGLVCVARCVPVMTGAFPGVIDEVYCTPEGQLLFLERYAGDDNPYRVLRNRCAELRWWDAGDLDVYCSDLQFQAAGKGGTLSDYMASQGDLQDPGAFNRAVSSCLEFQTFFYVIIMTGDRYGG